MGTEDDARHDEVRSPSWSAELTRHEHGLPVPRSLSNTTTRCPMTSPPDTKTTRALCSRHLVLLKLQSPLRTWSVHFHGHNHSSVDVFINSSLSMPDTISTLAAATPCPMTSPRDEIH
ncbi:hypothetical protein PHYSODRAFT_339577 [Phytophthora sojae]|uniref:Uncharacterized protein n=1 Tax=Phytophthora sojae (strain P6497) TaxID=1094619 RepID=G5A7A7_PHYSP|nr:hypothetical protein PHYSODRAFT_339577 [Phytophthora sojae]EGZ09212.1 hypothetical protein PHYSODRAFT_339577 [Phytophthora sojae]|eukprot:XP_009535845.1 hypothetical protein PHYSODRAFT_339577 [Phytophthora sojae]